MLIICAKDTVICLISNRRKSPILKSMIAYKLSQGKTNKQPQKTFLFKVKHSRFTALHYGQAPQAVLIGEF